MGSKGKFFNSWVIPFEFGKNIKHYKSNEAGTFIDGFIKAYGNDCVEHIRNTFRDSDKFSKADVRLIVESHFKFLEELFNSCYLVDFNPCVFPRFGVDFGKCKRVCNKILHYLKKNKDRQNLFEDNKDRIKFVCILYCRMLELLDGTCVINKLQQRFGTKDDCKSVIRSRNRQGAEYLLKKIDDIFFSIGLFNNRQEILDYGQKAIKSSPLYKIFGEELFGRYKQKPPYWSRKVKSCKLL